MSAYSDLNLSPGPLLNLFEGYNGTFADLDEGYALDGPGLRTLRDRISADLTRMGLAAGERILFAVGNGPTFAAALAAVLEIGGAPVLSHFETPPAELARLASLSGARFALCEGKSEPDLAPLSTRVLSLEASPGARLTFAELAADLVGRGSAEVCAGPELKSVPLHPTSGTTGTPKIAIRHAESAVAEATNYARTLGVTAEDTVLGVVPMSHGYGFGTCFVMPLVTGASLFSSRRFQPHLVTRALREYRVTVFPAVPAMLHLLLVATRGEIAGLPRSVLSAGAPLSERTAREFFEKAGQPVQCLYGTTETGGIAIDVTPEGAGVPGCVGPPMKTVEVKVRPLPDRGELEDKIGRVWVKSSSMMAGYLPAAASTGGHLTAQRIDTSRLVDGWFETGDLGYLDEAGRICLVARDSEVINVFGLKVLPAEVEAVIRELPEVSDVKVYAGRHKSGSQTVKAVVAGPESLDVAAIRAHCARQLVGYKRPEVINLLPSLPRTPAGKIILDQLP